MFKFFAFSIIGLSIRLISRVVRNPMLSPPELRRQEERERREAERQREIDASKTDAQRELELDEMMIRMSRKLL